MVVFSTVSNEQVSIKAEMSYKCNMKVSQVQYEGIWWFGDVLVMDMTKRAGDMWLHKNMLTHGPNAHITYQVSVSLWYAIKLHWVNSYHY